MVGSRSNRSPASIETFRGTVAIAMLGIGAWIMMAQITQKSTRDTDVINVPIPEAL